MHETSIILNVLDIAEKYCRKEGYSRIDIVKLRIGRASGVMNDALSFAFEIAKADTAASDAVLVIDEIPVGGECKTCGKNFIVDEEYILACPLCDSKEFTMTTGRELDIVELEVS